MVQWLQKNHAHDVVPESYQYGTHIELLFSLSYLTNIIARKVQSCNFFLRTNGRCHAFSFKIASEYNYDKDMRIYRFSSWRPVSSAQRIFARLISVLYFYHATSCLNSGWPIQHLVVGDQRCLDFYHPII